MLRAGSAPIHPSWLLWEGSCEVFPGDRHHHSFPWHSQRKHLCTGVYYYTLYGFPNRLAAECLTVCWVCPTTWIFRFIEPQWMWKRWVGMCWVVLSSSARIQDHHGYQAVASWKEWTNWSSCDVQLNYGNLCHRMAHGLEGGVWMRTWKRKPFSTEKCAENPQQLSTLIVRVWQIHRRVFPLTCHFCGFLFYTPKLDYWQS